MAVVDDDASVLKALARLLRASGFAVETYGSAQAFLDGLGRAIPQCLIVDLRMPGMTGLDLLRHLGGSGFDIPAVLITAYGEPGLAERCRAGGAVAWLEKPLCEAALLAAVRTAMVRTG